MIEVCTTYDGRPFDARTSGCTATMAYRPDKGGEIHIAYCGDSRAVIVGEKKGDPRGWDLTIDHKPNIPAEKRRIEASGGVVICRAGIVCTYTVWDCLHIGCAVNVFGKYHLFLLQSTASTITASSKRGLSTRG